mgnify:CR=1 FL=1
MADMFLLNILKAIFLTGIVAVAFGFIWLIVLFVFSDKEIMESQSRRSTSLGNALFVVHSIFEPGRKPQTEQVIWIKRRRTPVEKGVLGLKELNYDRFMIKGYMPTKGRLYKIKRGSIRWDANY